MQLNRNQLKNEWFGSHMSDETRLDHLFDLIEQQHTQPDPPVPQDGEVWLTVRVGPDVQEWRITQREDKTFAIELEMTEPDQLGEVLKHCSGVTAAYVDTPHWLVYRFIARDFFDLVAVLRWWSVI